MKKHISIIGSCVSRHIFNTPLLEATFTVDRYAYQVCAWDMFGDAFPVEKSALSAYYKEEFTARMVWYDLAKVAAREVEAAGSEYLMVDLYTLIQNVKRFELGDKVAYAQVSYDRYSPFLGAISKHDGWQDINVTTLPYTALDSSVIEAGLRRFAEWVITCYKPENVVINIPSFSKQYFDINNNLAVYPEELLLQFDALLAYIKIILIFSRLTYSRR